MNKMAGTAKSEFNVGSALNFIKKIFCRKKLRIKGEKQAYDILLKNYYTIADPNFRALKAEKEGSRSLGGSIGFQGVGASINNAEAKVIQKSRLLEKKLMTAFITTTRHFVTLASFRHIVSQMRHFARRAKYVPWSNTSSDHTLHLGELITWTKFPKK